MSSISHLSRQFSDDDTTMISRFHLKPKGDFLASSVKAFCLALTSAGFKMIREKQSCTTKKRQVQVAETKNK